MHMQKYIVISPFSSKLRNNNPNPKNYPWWPELIKLIDLPIVQIGIFGEDKLVDDFRIDLKLKEIKNLLVDCHTWISVDNFLPHLAHHVEKNGIVIWGKSDPRIFGYMENINILMSRKSLREDQFYIWDEEKWDHSVFPKPEHVARILQQYFPIED